MSYRDRDTRDGVSSNWKILFSTFLFYIGKKKKQIYILFLQDNRPDSHRRKWDKDEYEKKAKQREDEEKEKRREYAKDMNEVCT